ncbi:ATP-binding protein, partial [Collinsella aerofaciens]
PGVPHIRPSRLLRPSRNCPHQCSQSKKRLKYYAHSRLLIIDELGYLDVGSAGADLLFQLISTRYEQRSTIITTNVGISGWGRVFGDDVAASAIADRVCHHCHLVKITGRSYRLKNLPRDGPVKP